MLTRHLRMAVLLALCTTSLAMAQSYPAKPIRFIVPWSAGSGTDMMARAFAQRLGEAVGQQIVVDNRGGAGAVIGTEAAAKSPADGYVIYVGGSVSMVVSPAMYAKVGYDSLRDFAPVSLVSQFYNVASVHPSLPVKTVKELVALAKARPGELLMGSAGNGSTSHLAGALFNSMSGTQMLHVPYKSGGQLVVAVVSGEAHLSFSPVSTAIGPAAGWLLLLLRCIRLLLLLLQVIISLLLRSRIANGQGSAGAAAGRIHRHGRGTFSFVWIGRRLAMAVRAAMLWRHDRRRRRALHDNAKSVMVKEGLAFNLVTQRVTQRRFQACLGSRRTKTDRTAIYRVILARVVSRFETSDRWSASGQFRWIDL